METTGKKTKYDIVWDNNFSEFVEFVNKNRRLPKACVDEHERHLANWIRNTRDAYSKGKLSQYRIDKLNSLSTCLLNSDNFAGEFNKMLRNNLRTPFKEAGLRSGAMLDTFSLTDAQVADLISIGILDSNTLGRVLQSHYCLINNPEILDKNGISRDKIANAMRVLEKTDDRGMSIIKAPSVIVSVLKTMDSTFDMGAINIAYKAIAMETDIVQFISNPTNIIEGMSDRVKYVCSFLNNREQLVLIYRFCFKLTLEEIGGILSVSRERVRQIEAKAIRKIRAKDKYNYAILNINKQVIDKQTEIKYAGDYRHIPLENADLSVRSYNCLKRAGYDTIGEIIASARSTKTEDLDIALFKVRNMGLRSRKEVIAKIQELEKLGDSVVISDEHTEVVVKPLDMEEITVREGIINFNNIMEAAKLSIK